LIDTVELCNSDKISEDFTVLFMYRYTDSTTPRVYLSGMTRKPWYISKVAGNQNSCVIGNNQGAGKGRGGSAGDAPHS